MKKTANRFPAYLQVVQLEPSEDLSTERTDASHELIHDSSDSEDASHELIHDSFDLDDDSSDSVDTSSKLKLVSSDKTNAQSTVIWEHAERSDAFDETYVLAGAADAPILRIRLVSSGFGNGILCQAA